MLRFTHLLVSVSFVACVASPDDDPADTDTNTGSDTETGDTDPADDDDGSQPPPTAMAACATGQHDVRMTGTGLAQYDGLRVVVAATEGTQQGSTSTFTRAAWIPGTIANGAFDVSCAAALTDNLWYPSVAAYIDVNGDGHCSAGDRGWGTTYYGWMYDVENSVEPSAWQDIPSANLVGPLQGQGGFCADFFE
jgi:hypothetical protein